LKRVVQWALFAGLLLAPVAASAGRHDPLTSDEIDQLRETALEPEKRLKLLADFARLRFTAIENARTPAPKKSDAESPRSLHDLMEDFLDVYDELDENISMYDDRQADLRKAMKIVLQADGEFHARLEGLQHNLTAEERKDCDFVLNSIVEAITSGATEHKKMQAEQEVSAKNRKKK
jgi:DNA repair exonuclease SbcCD ATPase subunit